MKARVKATGEIVEISEELSYVGVEHSENYYNLEQLELLDVKEKSFPKDAPDYWTRLEHQYAGMAMQQLVTLVNAGYEYVYEETAIIAMNFAHALVEKLKESK